MTAQTSSDFEMRPIIARGFVMVFLITLTMAGAMFLAAGSLVWPLAWAFLASYLIFFAIWVSWGLRNRPDLIKERGRALQNKDAKAWDQAIVRINLLFSLIMYLVAGLDAVRYGWTSVSVSVQVLGGGLLLFSYGFSFWALASNPFASGTVRIQKERGHTVSTGGPYRFVRHPMYVGSLAGDIGIPLLLGSYWALIPGLFMAVLFIYRTWREDLTLQEELPGYKEYSQKVRYRLLPGIW
jgi:protein-S-isoprenylcysteine O-methyltransferase Ste14